MLIVRSFPFWNVVLKAAWKIGFWSTHRTCWDGLSKQGQGKADWRERSTRDSGTAPPTSWGQWPGDAIWEHTGQSPDPWAQKLGGSTSAWSHVALWLPPKSKTASHSLRGKSKVEKAHSSFLQMLNSGRQTLILGKRKWRKISGSRVLPGEDMVKQQMEEDHTEEYLSSI